MNTQHSTFSLGGFAVHQIAFNPATFSDADLLWLPHHAKIQSSGKKRKAEHLAGRLAAFYALQHYGLRHIPDIGDSRQPLWPQGYYGSISHSGTTALAVVAAQPVGVDIETVFDADMCHETEDSIITPAERRVLVNSGLPFALGLTLAFSAKESAYKTLSFMINGLPGFSDAEVIALDAKHITLRLSDAFSPALTGRACQIGWRQTGQRVMTLLVSPTRENASPGGDGIL
jgi:enterobactin synthetase component D